MKTHNNTINIQESDLEIRDGKNMIFSIIDNQINNYKLQALTNWERDHNSSSNESDRSIQQLEETKEKYLHIKGDEPISHILGMAEESIFDFTSTPPLGIVIVATTHKTTMLIANVHVAFSRKSVVFLTPIT